VDDTAELLVDIAAMKCARDMADNWLLEDGTETNDGIEITTQVENPTPTVKAHLRED